MSNIPNASDQCMVKNCNVIRISPVYKAQLPIFNYTRLTDMLIGRVFCKTNTHDFHEI